MMHHVFTPIFKNENKFPTVALKKPPAYPGSVELKGVRNVFIDIDEPIDYLISFPVDDCQSIELITIRKYNTRTNLSTWLGKLPVLKTLILHDNSSLERGIVGALTSKGVDVHYARETVDYHNHFVRVKHPKDGVGVDALFGSCVSNDLTAIYRTGTFELSGVTNDTAVVRSSGVSLTNLHHFIYANEGVCLNDKYEAIAPLVLGLSIVGVRCWNTPFSLRPFVNLTSLTLIGNEVEIEINDIPPSLRYLEVERSPITHPREGLLDNVLEIPPIVW